MTDNSIHTFASEEYLLLLWLSEHLTETKAASIIKFSQSEIAQEQGCSPTTINKRMQALQRVKCIQPHGKKGNYIITETGNQVIKQMKQIERLIGGHQNG